MPVKRSQPFKVIIIALFLGVGNSLLWLGCTGPPAAATLVETIPPTITATYTPRSTITAAPTVTAIRTSRPIPRPAADRRVQNPVNQHLYLYVKEGKTWHEARDYCAARDGHLVTIQAPSENRFVYNLATDNVQVGTWLGATDEINEGTWVWVTGEPWEYRNWLQDGKYTEPNDRHGDGTNGADFLFFDFWSRNWVDWRDGEAYFVCEWEPASS